MRSCRPWTPSWPSVRSGGREGRADRRHRAGPMPVEVLDRLLALGDRVVWVRGNADRELVALARGGAGEIPDAIAPWAASQLTPRHVQWLSQLPYPVQLEIAGFGEVLFCHGTPRDDDEVVLVDSRLDWWREVLSDLPDRVRTVVCGHTHMPFLRLAHGRQIVNPGSVGMPYGQVVGLTGRCSPAVLCRFAAPSLTSGRLGRPSAPRRHIPMSPSGRTITSTLGAATPRLCVSSGRATAARVSPRPGTVRAAPAIANRAIRAPAVIRLFHDPLDHELAVAQRRRS